MKKSHKSLICRTFLVLGLFCLSLSAEREGFEPPEPRSSTVFKTAAIDHSAISPMLNKHCAFPQKRCKDKDFFEKSKYLRSFFHNIFRLFFADTRKSTPFASLTCRSLSKLGFFIENLI